MDPRKKEFRRCLNRLSNQLSRQNVEDMKFVCKDHVPVSRMERVMSSLDIFQALEERGKLSHTDTSFLVKVLVSIERSNLVSELVSAGFAKPDSLQRQQALPPLQGGLRTMQPPGDQGSSGHGRELLFNEMLLKIAQNLSARDVESLTFTLCDSVLGMNADRVSSATQLFQLLQQRQIVTPTNLQALFNELENIGRSDLSKKINNYLTEIGRPPCQPGMDEDGVPMTGGLPPVSNQTIEAAEETQYPQMMASRPPPQGPQQTPPAANSFYQYQPRPTATDQGYQPTPYGVTEKGQPIGTPTDSSEPSLMSTTTGSYSLGSAYPSGHAYSGSAPSQQSYPSPESSAMDPNSMRAQSGEYDHRIRHASFVPSQVFPITSKSGLSVAETGGHDIPLQDEPLTLSFNTNDDEDEQGEGQVGAGLSKLEIQDLKQQWLRTQELLTAKELQQKQLQENLESLQQQTAKIMEEREGESMQYETNRRELESALQMKVEEIQQLRQQVHGLQQGPRPPSNMNPDDYYPLNKNPHGVCLIINNHHFYHETDPSKAHPDRGGAEIDQYNLTQTFRYLRYKVEVRENLTADQMVDTLLRMSQRDHTNYDSFVCCILSHGENNIIHGADSKAVNIDDLTGVMKLCKSLRNKPKLFFMQCCRGEAEELGFEKDNPGEGGVFHSTIPRDADFFLGYATPLGKAAYRSRKHGSWYISELCKVFTQYGYHYSLSSMMRRVNLQVSNAFTKDGYKQCAEFVDRLRQEVHFFHFIRNRPRGNQ